jgi:hypothetical protein
MPKVVITVIKQQMDPSRKNLGEIFMAVICHSNLTALGVGICEICSRGERGGVSVNDDYEKE